MDGFGMGLLWVWPLLLLGGLGLLVWGLARALSAPRAGTPPGEGRAREILRERFARGEITEQELRDRLRVLDEQ